MDYTNLINEYIEEGVSARKSIDPAILDKAVNLICKSLRKGNKIIAFGNGGSAADAQHIVGEFIGVHVNPKENENLKNPRKPIPAIALTVNTSNITAIANDYSYDEIFSRQLEGVGCKGDVAIAISTSGNSKNVIAAVKKAKELGIHVIVLTGGSGGQLKDMGDLTILIKSSKTSIIQEGHLTACHLISILVEKELFG
jgi:D-sedoheptulose 7-phosphate isomerase